MADAEGDALILEAARGTRRLSEAELQRVLQRVARAGFDPNAREQVRGRLAGLVWRGRTLRGKDRLPPVEVHYLWHVVKQQEWPEHTSLDQYGASIKAVLLDEASGVFSSEYQDTWQLGVVRQSRELRGPGGFGWILIDYRLVTGHWVTAYQPEHGLRELRNPRRSNLRWLRQLQQTGE